MKDDGCGVAEADLPLLCARFATSKLVTVQDLSTLHTFGFRGEALASLSRVAQVTVCTRTEEQPSGLEARYRHERMLGPPQTCAMARGTKIAAEDMFAELPGRRDTLGSANEEFHCCLRIVQMYAIQRHTVKFILISGGKTVLTTPGAGTRLAILQQIYSHPELATQLLPLALVTESVTVAGFASNPNYSLAKSEFILFVNDRLVESEALHTALQRFYAASMPDHYTFVYFSLTVPTDLIDVNLHPTKREVKFLNESQVFSGIQCCLQTEFTKSEQQRTISVRTLSQPGSRQPGPATQVRTDWTSSRLDWKVKTSQPSPQSPDQLKSIHELKAAIIPGDLQPLFDQFCYVGCIDQGRVLVQYDTGLYLLQVCPVLEELAYQDILEHFGQLKGQAISPVQLRDALNSVFALPHVQYSPERHGPTEALVSKAVQVLETHAALLDTYFQLSLSQGCVVQIPQLCEGNLTGHMEQLGELLFHIATDIRWDSEKACLERLCREFAWWFAEPPLEEDGLSYDQIYRDRIFPYVRGHLKADSRTLSVGAAVVKVTSTEELYQVFERC